MAPWSRVWWSTFETARLTGLNAERSCKPTRAPLDGPTKKHPTRNIRPTDHHGPDHFLRNIFAQITTETREKKNKPETPEDHKCHGKNLPPRSMEQITVSELLFYSSSILLRSIFCVDFLCRFFVLQLL